MTKVRKDIRLEPELLQKLENIARKENRSLSNLIETILTGYLKEIKDLKEGNKG